MHLRIIEFSNGQVCDLVHAFNHDRYEAVGDFPDLRITTPLYHYTTGIFRPNESECEASNDYHVWTIVGFGVHGDQPYWIIKNSWGTK
ncbi:unnamed protein product [Toxocara canis]|uniref:Pept_C1 domain-containing protein n=1 Tax=Toxocara canis TaxID=6265 RepID=A0A183U704_TOXCA|nr:unnamed protein product [Toxocara canis]